LNDQVWAILPVKSLGWAKRRLRQWLSPAERRALVLELFHLAVAALAEVLPPRHIIVVTHDAALLAQAGLQGLLALRQSGYGLNTAVRQGEQRAIEGGAGAVLVILPDLPLIAAADIAALLASLSNGRQVVIAAGQRGGTHALLVQPPGWLSFAFGGGSYARHVSRAQSGGASIVALQNERLALDIDTVEDLRRSLLARPELLAEPGRRGERNPDLCAAWAAGGAAGG